MQAQKTKHVSVSLKQNLSSRIEKKKNSKKVRRPGAKQTKKTIQKANELIQKGYKTFPLQPLLILIFGTKIDQAAVLL